MAQGLDHKILGKKVNNFGKRKEKGEKIMKRKIRVKEIREKLELVLLKFLSFFPFFFEIKQWKENLYSFSSKINLSQCSEQNYWAQTITILSRQSQFIAYVS